MKYPLVRGVSMAAAALAASSALAHVEEGAAEARPRYLMSQLTTGEFDKIESQYHEQLKAALPPGRLAEGWKQLIGQVGAFHNVTESSLRTVQSNTIATLVCIFDKATIDVVITFTTGGRIGGIRFVPHQTRVEWRPPAYSNPDSIQERAVTITFERWELPGKLTLPRADGSFPAVVLVHGSGPHDEDETVGANKPFKDLAWGLASRGVAVLRYVKRTSKYPGDLGDDPAAFTVNDETVNDARAAMALVAKQPGVDSKRICLLGHSLGGYLVPRICEEGSRPARVVIMAGPTRSMALLAVEQIRYLANLSHMSAGEVERRMSAVESSARAIENPELKKGDIVEFLGARIPASYFLDLRGYAPGEAAARLSIPILVLRGARDYQVGDADFEGWTKALRGHSNATLKTYPLLNHLFIAGQGVSTPNEYDAPGHVSEEVIHDIADWVLSSEKNGGQVKRSK